MALLRHLTRGLRTLLRRRQADADLSDELAHFLDEATRDNIRRGLPPQEARRAAHIAIGSPAAIRTQLRESTWEHSLDALAADFRYAARRLRHNPSFTLVSILTLALGIGASAAIFSVLDGVLLKPLPYPQSGRLVALLHTAPGLRIPELNVAASLFLTYRDENHTFESLGMWSPDSWTVTGLANPEDVRGLSVTEGFLATLGVRPALGRTFTQGDEDPGSGRPILLSDNYWRSRFGADPAILGRRLVLDGTPSEIVGVLPPGFQFLDYKISLLAPLQFQRANIRLISFCCQGIARLRPGVTLQQANADVARMLPMAPRKFAMNPGFSATAFDEARIGPHLRPLKDVFVGDTGRLLWILMGTVGLVLAIACANVANLLLVRAEGRRSELAVRAALGAPHARLARELLLESLLLGLAGAAAGWAFATAALRLLLASDWVHLPRLQQISMDTRATLFTFAVALAASLLLGLIPVLKYARPESAGALHTGTRTLTAGRDRQRLRGALVTIQVALALILLVGSGLMLRTFQALAHVDPGITTPHHIETVRVAIPAAVADTPQRVLQREREILRRLAAIAGVEHAAAIDQLPLDGGSNDPVYAEDQPQQTGHIPPPRRFKYISPGYFTTAGTRVIAGRDLTWTDIDHGAPVALVSESLARTFWTNPTAALGKRIRVTTRDDWREIIGVVADIADNGLDQPAPPTAYWPLLTRNFEASPEFVVRNLAYILRTPRAGAATLRQDIQQAVWQVDGTLPLAEVQTLATVYDRSLARNALALVLLALAGAMALLLAAVGLYAVIAYTVAQRTREIGIRLALGAVPGAVIGHFVRNGLRLSAYGALAGIAAALALSRLLRALLYDVSPADPATYATALAVLLLAAAAGSYLPARRAARVDPVIALRAE